MTDEERKEKIDRANAYHNEGFNCCQAVLAAYTNEMGMTVKQALALGGGFGGGMRHGEVCGAVSAAIMILSMTHPYTKKDDAESKRRIANLTREFHRRFLEKFGRLTCRELLSMDISEDAAMAAAKSSGKMSRCPDFIASAVTIVGDMLEEEDRETL